MMIETLMNQLDIDKTDVEMYGSDKAKLSLNLLNRERKGKLILMTAINPTPAGEGKTTMNIGLSMALNKLGYKAISALREPSMGPVFGMKGGATGGGMAMIHPSTDINLHFTGDMHAITAAHNLLAAMTDNHVYHGNELGFETVVWGRAMDMNDRALRRIKLDSRDSFFDITAASEVMAILCLAEDMDDLKHRLEKIIVGYTKDGAALSAKDIGAVDAMLVVLKDAMKPNLVRTSEDTPAIVHGGPFANIAHGCNSVIATKMSLGLSDYVVTEAGFGADLGAEKFFDIKCRQSGLEPDATVLVATIRALKYNGGVLVKDLDIENVEALREGSKNLIRHIENMKKYQKNVIMALNQFKNDTPLEIETVRSICAEHGVTLITTTVFVDGGSGALELAQEVVKILETPNDFELLYGDDKTPQEMIEKVAKEIYRADGVVFSDEALEKLQTIPKGYPVCIAKTQYSFSDDPKKLNAPEGFTVHVRDIRVSNGAGFWVAMLGKIMTMPGLPKKPNAVQLQFDE